MGRGQSRAGHSPHHPVAGPASALSEFDEDQQGPRDGSGRSSGRAIAHQSVKLQYIGPDEVGSDRRVTPSPAWRFSADERVRHRCFSFRSDLSPRGVDGCDHRSQEVRLG